MKNGHLRVESTLGEKPESLPCENHKKMYIFATKKNDQTELSLHSLQNRQVPHCKPFCLIEFNWYQLVSYQQIAI